MPTFEQISPTGSFVWRAFGTGSTIPVTTATVGNAWFIGIGATGTVTNLSAGNATNWQKITPTNQNTGGSPLVNFEIWMGQVTAVGSTNISVSASGQWGAYGIALTCTNVGPNTSWGVDVGGARDNASNSTNVTFPALATAGPNRAYVGMTIVGSDVATSGQPSGWSIYRDPGPYFNGIGVNGTVGTGTITPVWKQTASDDSYNVGALIYAQNPDKGNFFPFQGGPGHHVDELAERRMRRGGSGLYVPGWRPMACA